MQTLSAALADFFALPAGQGVVVSDVRTPPGGALQRGDVILEVDGTPVRDARDFQAKLDARARHAELSVQRDGAPHPRRLCACRGAPVD